MFYTALEFISRIYYSIKNKISSCLFTELSIIPFQNENSLKYVYYYYILNYLLCNYIELLLNLFRCSTNYNTKKYYEFTYRDNNIIRMSILEGSIQDVFNYTRRLKIADKMMVFIKCNLIMKNEEAKINIRNIVRKYDTRTKLYDIVYYNYNNELNLDIIQSIELGKNTYDIKSLDRNLYLEDA
jgi:hypothetical protein